MKRLFILATGSLLLAVYVCIAGLGSNSEKSKYDSTMPGETYFVCWSNINGQTSISITNSETEIWFPTKVKVYNSDMMGTTSTLDHIIVIPTYVYASDTVTTNDSGTVTTNHFHGAVTNTTFTYITNRLCTITNTTAATLTATDRDLVNEYISKYDVLVWSFQQSNGWFNIIGKR
jgi:hypothetical protein